MVQYTKEVRTYQYCQVEKSIYDWIIQHTQVVQSPIANYCLKVSIGVHSETQLVPKYLLQVSIWELHNSMVSPPENVRLNESIDADNKIIISNSILRNILPPQIKKMPARYKVICDMFRKILWQFVSRGGHFLPF